LVENKPLLRDVRRYKKHLLSIGYLNTIGRIGLESRQVFPESRVISFFDSSSKKL
jgi:hypothetical protein